MVGFLLRYPLEKLDATVVKIQQYVYTCRSGPKSKKYLIHAGRPEYFLKKKSWPTGSESVCGQDYQARQLSGANLLVVYVVNSLPGANRWAVPYSMHYSSSGRYAYT